MCVDLVLSMFARTCFKVRSRLRQTAVRISDTLIVHIDGDSANIDHCLHSPPFANLQMSKQGSE
jgi:hypothetical protein